VVSPMREKRAWPPHDKDADGETVAAFEAAVAVVKETVVRSGEVLVSAKEDLSDHQRWLKAQTAAVQADRQRHDRWLQRQRERQEALERREQKRARRRAARQAVWGSITDAVSAAVFAVGSAVRFVVAKTLFALNSIDRLAWSGLAWMAVRLRGVALSVAGVLSRGLLGAGRAAQAFALWLGRLFSSVFSRVAAKAQAWAPSVANFLSICFGGLAARGRDAARSIGRGSAAKAVSGISARAYTLGPSLWDELANVGLAVRHHAREGAARVQGLLPAAMASRVGAENAVSLPQRVGGFDLSQMLIIAGTLLLVCGGLMLGGGLILRAGTPSRIAATASPSEPVAWYFEHKDLPLAARSIFIYSTMPEGVRIKGFSIGAENLSEQPLVSVGGVIKPDLHDEELKLDVIAERPGGDASGTQQAATEAPAGTIPPQAPFKLVFLFPAAEDGGMKPEEVLAGAGGLMLKVHYEVGGKEKSFIQYLPATLLEDQLAEITAEAKGS